LARIATVPQVRRRNFYARFAVFRPSKPKPGFHPNTRKPRVLGSPGSLGAAARGPAAQGIVLAAACTARLRSSGILF